MPDWINWVEIFKKVLYIRSIRSNQHASKPTEHMALPQEINFPTWKNNLATKTRERTMKGHSQLSKITTMPTYINTSKNQEV